MFNSSKPGSSSRRFKSNPQSNFGTADEVLNDKSRITQKQAEVMQPLMAANINEKISQKSQRQNLINQKGAAPITDPRTKRAATTLDAHGTPPGMISHTSQMTNMVTGMMSHGSQPTMPLNTASQLMMLNLQQNASFLNMQVQRPNKKFVELAQKANTSMLAA
jgi:hypothetical protein